MYIRKAFTLIELLVVIVIIGVLATLAIVALSSARGKARDVRRLSDLKQISTALELYMADENVYPMLITPGQPMVGLTSGKTYMSKVPTNPGGSSNVQANNPYSYFSNGSKYTLRTYTENGVNDLPAGGKIVASSVGVKMAENTDSIIWDTDLTFGGTLVGHYALDGNTGTRDLAGNSTVSAITASGGVSTTTGRFGEAEGAYSFNGTTGYVYSVNPSEINLTNITASVWFYPYTMQEDFAGLFFALSGHSSRNRVLLTGSKLYTQFVYSSAGQSNVYTTNSVNFNQWNYMAYVFDGTTEKIYLNGVITTTTKIDTLVGDGTALTIGRGSSSIYFFNGLMSDARVYRKALSPDEITQLYNATKP
ncbi:prepilin-type N-terminal cleavage/methylation domain-containing protein [Candidatus Falkowbacteria bacterium]|nr:prepilin-type N-terminal cleavage/methylation domain-containing protein [Candidatus Falkowbacteria bacterium]